MRFHLELFLFFSLTIGVSSEAKNCPEQRVVSTCRCVDKQGKSLCKTHNVCPDNPYRCVKGYFGAKCSYVDIASADDDPEYPALTNGNYPSPGDSCKVFEKEEQYTINFPHSVKLTWIRIILGGLDRPTKALVRSVVLPKSRCSDPQLYLYTNILDIFCDAKQQANSLTFRFERRIEICKVFVSYGRNIYDTVLPTEVFGKLVAGCIQDAFDMNSRTCFTMTRSRNREFISLSLNIKQYFGYNFRLWKRKIRFISVKESKVAIVTRLVSGEYEVCRMDEIIKKGDETEQYVNCPLNSQDISEIHIISAQAAVKICEIEVYGEDICPGNRWGPQCENECHCPNGESCFPQSGGCKDGCHKFYTGTGCNFHRPVNGQIVNKNSNSYCNIQAHKNEKVEFYNGENLVKQIRYKETGNPTMPDLSKVTRKDEGTYHCFIEDKDGWRRGEGHHQLVFEDYDYYCVNPNFGNDCKLQCNCVTNRAEAACLKGQNFQNDCVCSKKHSGQLCNIDIPVWLIREGRSIRIKCSFGNSDSDARRTSWFKDSRSITATGRINRVFDVKNHLYIKALSTSDSGSYQCTLEENSFEWQKTTVHLQIYKENRVPFFQYIWFKGQDVHLPCILEKNGFKPYFDIHWGKNGKYLAQTNSRHQFETFPDQSLTIKNVEDSDSGQYFCFSNSIESKETGFSIFLNIPSYTTIGPNSLKAAVNIYDGAYRVTIPCLTKKEKLVDFLWKKNGMSLSASNKISMDIDTGKMEIKSLKKADEGVYRCCYIVDNGQYTWSTIVFTITITDSPKLVNKVDEIPKPNIIEKNPKFPTYADYYPGQNDSEKLQKMKRAEEEKIRKLQESISLDGNCSDSCSLHSCNRRGACLECLKNFYGEKCEKPCESCTICNSSGLCMQPCPDGYFGPGCILDCAKNCSLDKCTPILGLCLDCKAGYYGTLCDIKCPLRCLFCQRDGTCITIPGLTNKIIGLATICIIIVTLYFFTTSVLLNAHKKRKNQTDEMIEQTYAVSLAASAYGVASQKESKEEEELPIKGRASTTTKKSHARMSKLSSFGIGLPSSTPARRNYYIPEYPLGGLDSATAVAEAAASAAGAAASAVSSAAADAMDGSLVAATFGFRKHKEVRASTFGFKPAELPEEIIKDENDEANNKKKNGNK